MHYGIRWFKCKLKPPKNRRSSFSLGREVGLIVVDDEQAGAEEDQSEEDREVQKIMDNRRAVKHKILTGNIHNVAKLYMFVYGCQNGQNSIYYTVYFTFISAVRTVKAGHQMVAQGWNLFEEVVKDAGAGDLPQLLRYIKTMTTPPPATPPPKMDVSGVTPSPVKKEPGTGKEPVYVKVGGESTLLLPPV